MLNQTQDLKSIINTHSDSHPFKDHYKVVVMGAARVGKTAIIHRFLHDAFKDNHEATIEQLHRKVCFELGGNRHFTLDILDTSGTYQFPAMRELSMTQADAFVLVYAVDSVESFEEVRKQREMILKNGRNGTNLAVSDRPIVVVGNKCDVVATERTISRETAESLACIDWEHNFVETSAKCNINIDKIFQVLFPQMDFHFNRRPSTHRRSRLSLPQVFAHSGVCKFRLLKRHSCVIA